MQLPVCLDEKQSQLKKTVSTLAKKHLNIDVDGQEPSEDRFRDAWEALAGIGLCGLIVAKGFGGREMKAFESLAVFEGLGEGCIDNGLMNSLHAHTWGCEVPICHFGSEAQKKKYLPGLAQGSLIGASAMTEPGAGSNVYALETVAEKKGDMYVLNGSKQFITNAPVADIFIIYCRTGKKMGFGGISSFIVERKTPGLRVEQPLAGMSLTTLPLSALSLSDCRIPEESLLGKEHSGAMVFADSIEWERTFVMSTAIGTMERQLHECVDFININKADQVKKGSRQYLGNKTADMKIRLESARMLVYNAAALKQAGRMAYLEATLAKIAASEAFVANCKDAVTIFSTGNMSQRIKADRDLRDAMASTLYSGATDVLKDTLSKLLN